MSEKYRSYRLFRYSIASKLHRQWLFTLTIGAGKAMLTDVWQVNREAPAPEVIARAATVIRRGGLVAFPTETVYGLGANALDSDAVARIFAAKGRPANNPLIVHVSGAEGTQQVAGDWPEVAARLAERFWPGPLTLVLPRRDPLPANVTAGGPTVAVRMPAHAVALALIRAAGVPLAAPSANCSTSVSPTRPEHVLSSLDGRIDLILDGGPTAKGIESTVLNLTTNPPSLLRPGPVALSAIEAVIGRVQRNVPLSGQENPLPSPGLLVRHYAPRAPLECRASDAGSRVEELERGGLRVGWLTFAAPAHSFSTRVMVTVLPSEPVAYAAQLYAALHAFDANGVERIVVTLPPETEEWSAVLDRLRRASTPGIDKEDAARIIKSSTSHDLR